MTERNRGRPIRGKLLILRGYLYGVSTYGDWPGAGRPRGVSTGSGLGLAQRPHTQTQLPAVASSGL